MDRVGYIDFLKRRFERYFDIEVDSEVLGLKVDMFAKHYALNGRTFLTKKDVIDSYENNEFVFVKYYKNLNLKVVDEFIEFLKRAESEFVKPNKNHMSTYINGILVYEEIDNSAIEKIKRFRNSKTFLFGLKGWFDTRLLAINLGGQDIFCNKEGKRVKKVYKIAP
ncbi:MAG: hypothetical protein N2594_01505 [Clostridiales bacterium]|nr:hypothetical protein [Clostridiales bacterium]